MTHFLIIGIGVAIGLILAIPVASVILGAGVWASLSGPVSFLDSLGSALWNQSTNYLLVSIPLFILFGEILVRSGIAGRMYAAITPWLHRIPGRLMQSNVVTSAVFAATSGSSVATAATISAIAVPEIDKGGYNERLFLGTIAAGGTLGILIPPSINLIVYGALTNTSIPQLYLAGLIPGLALMFLFMTLTALICIARPGWQGGSLSFSWRDRLSTLPSLIPPAVIFTVVIGSIYMGIATPTEAAALGVLASFVLAYLFGALSLSLINESLLATVRTTAMLMAIMVASAFLNFVLGYVGFSRMLEGAVLGSGLPPFTILSLIVLGYMILGCFLDGLSMTVLTVPILTPIVVQMGFDPVWFGIVVILATEMGLITPPVGMNCFVVQGVRGRGSILDVFVGVSPFFICIVLLIAAMSLYPSLALWLPQFMR